MPAPDCTSARTSHTTPSSTQQESVTTSACCWSDTNTLAAAKCMQHGICIPAHLLDTHQVTTRGRYHIQPPQRPVVASAPEHRTNQTLHLTSCCTAAPSKKITTQRTQSDHSKPSYVLLLLGRGLPGLGLGSTAHTGQVCLAVPRHISPGTSTCTCHETTTQEQHMHQRQLSEPI